MSAPTFSSWGTSSITGCWPPGITLPLPSRAGKEAPSACIDPFRCACRYATTGSAVVGIASTYNPFRPGYRSGGRETASGELYDPAAWAAAIQTNLRGRFGGVRYGKNYRPTYALVSSQDKQVIVKVNDVGPLEPGRVVDLNEQTMRYFDPEICNAGSSPSPSHHCVVLIGYQGL
jgi:hypothetical protein